MPLEAAGLPMVIVAGLLVGLVAPAPAAARHSGAGSTGLPMASMLLTFGGWSEAA